MLLVFLILGPATVNAQSAATAPAISDSPGPIPIRNGRAYNQLVLQFAPESPDVLRHGGTQLGVQLDVFNNLLIPNPTGGSVEEDYEEQRVLLSFRKGIGHGSELGFFLPIRYRNGGFMDAILREWHQLWSIPNHTRDDRIGRDHESDYRSHLRLFDQNGNKLIDAGDAFGIGDVSVSIKHELMKATRRSALSGRIGIKAPTGNPGQLLGSGSFDIGLSLDGRYNIRPWLTLFANAGQVYSGGATRVPAMQHWVSEYMFAVDIHPNSRDSYMFQAEGNSTVVRTGNRRADEPQSTFTLGYQRKLNPGTTVYSSFSENGDWAGYSSTLFGGVGPDFTITMGINWRK